ncbi:MAG: acyltransferase family protein [Tissierellia bacterium]|nr:acyltransferase family protein [Tissierellia bacterium]
MVKTRHPGVDRLKSLALIFIVGIHVSTLWMGDFFSRDWITALVFNSVFRAGVPLFFMVNGFLLLDPDKPLPLEKLYKKNLLRILGALFLWAGIYQVRDMVVEGDLSLGRVQEALVDLVSFNHEQHLYFLHIMVLVYVFLPLTRLLVKKGGPRL